jgi:ERCC4-type nuclease
MDVPLEFFIDVREASLVARLGGEVISKQLDIGDFQVVTSGNPVLVLERKTISDLEASIKDGRYREQKCRLLALRSTGCKLLYLIEGAFKYNEDTPRNKIMTGSVINTMIRDQIPFVFTKNVDDTAAYITSICARITADPDKYFNATCEPYSSKIKQKKKDNVDEQTCFILQLCAIPGISHTKAVSIIDSKKVANMADLCSKMAQTPRKEFFKDVKGIGSVLQGNIYRFCGIDANGQ